MKFKIFITLVPRPSALWANTLQSITDVGIFKIYKLILLTPNFTLKLITLYILFQVVFKVNIKMSDSYSRVVYLHQTKTIVIYLMTLEINNICLLIRQINLLICLFCLP